MLYFSYSRLGFSPGFIAGLFLIAMFSWTLFEYAAHRYLFHLRAKSEFGQRIIYIFHGNHHEYPRDRSRLFMPPLPSILLAGTVFLIIWCLSFLVSGTGNYGFIYFPGFIIGYLGYVSIHYAIHAFPPPRGMKALWRNHHLHHYKFPERGFGVSNTLWDHIFHTVPEKDVPDINRDERTGKDYSPKFKV
jgi:sterol desaturase/sphingolipid hydroxylase (fatty acid hydroxylase superfamily)